MKINSLRQFLLDSNQAGYVTGQEKQWIKQPDGSTTIPFTKGKFRSDDNFFGGEPYGGRLVVFYEQKAVWMMVYYGWVAEQVDTNAIYAILRGALKQMPADAPFRGPAKFMDGEFEYVNSWQGDIERYEGEERITHLGKTVYKANYRGGLVDQRTGL